MRSIFGMGAAIVLVCLCGPSRAQTREEIPVRAVPLDNGAVLYSIPISVGGTRIEAGLDTGSTGLRVLPGTLADADAKLGSGLPPGNFASGVRYDGHAATGNFAIGALSGSLYFEHVDSISCMAGRPDCPAGSIAPGDYGVRGNSLTAGRFKAIFGINTADQDIPNPLLALGVKRWIVELPRAGETGRLILNPSDAEADSFTPVSNIPALHDHGGFRDAVNGCLIDAETKKHECGALVMDSGAPSIRLHNLAAPDEILADGRKAAFVLFDAGDPRVIETVTLGQTPLGTHIRADRGAPELGVIFAGTAPYMGLSVLYDPGHRRIGVKPRPATDQVPMPQIVTGK